MRNRTAVVAIVCIALLSVSTAARKPKSRTSRDCIACFNAGRLGLTPDQAQKIDTIVAAARKAISDVNHQQLSPNEKRDRIHAIVSKEKVETLALLSETQQKELGKMKQEHIDSMNQFNDSLSNVDSFVDLIVTEEGRQR